MNETKKISYDDFAKIELKAGKILSAEKIPDTDKLLKLMVDFGETEEVKEVVTETIITDGTAEKDSTEELSPAIKVNEAEIVKEIIKEPVKLIPKHRQIVSGISLHFSDPAVLVGKVCMFVTNLEPRMIRGYESDGMIFALSTPATPENPQGAFSLLEPGSNIPVGTKAK